MALIWDLMAVAFAALLGMFIMWPLLKRGAGSKEAQEDRWRTLWRAGLICWVLGVVTVHFVGLLRKEVETIDLKTEQAIQSIRQQQN